MRVLTVVGARPEFIKSLALSRVFVELGHEELVVHTGQHYDADMSDVFFDELGLPQPWRRLDTRGTSHAEQTASMLVGLEIACREASPDWVVVYGDTNSTLAGGLAAAKLHCRVAHVEAGLRSFNRAMPEELNRVVVDHISTALFAPTSTAVRHLHREGIDPSWVHLVGDVNYDVTLMVSEMVASSNGERIDDPVAAYLATRPGPGYIVATVHRAETTDNPDRLRNIFEGLEMVGADLPVVVPVHPRTRAALDRNQIKPAPDRVHMIDPIGFVDMIRLMTGAQAVATDSGGVQKEALFLKVPCATLRSETEWVETIEFGWNRLVPLESAGSVANGIRSAIGSKGRPATPYGEGRAAATIAAVLERY